MLKEISLIFQILSQAQPSLAPSMCSAHIITRSPVRNPSEFEKLDHEHLIFVTKYSTRQLIIYEVWV